MSVPQGGTSQPTSAPTVTVIRIGDGTNEVNLPYVLQDRGRAPTSGNWVLTRQSSTNPAANQQLPKESNAVITINAEVSDTNSKAEIQQPTSERTRNVERPFIKGEVTAEDRQETGSVITMTSDERVQIFVPSPQGTPYNTITKGSALNTGNGSTTSAIITGNGNLAPLFVPNRIPNSESYRSLTPLNMSANSPAHDPGSNPDAAACNNSSVQKVLQETSLEMIKISLVSSEGDSAEVNLQSVQPQDSSNLQGESLSETLSTLAPATDKTIANDIESLPVDQPQPVSLSHIELEEI